MSYVAKLYRVRSDRNSMVTYRNEFCKTYAYKCACALFKLDIYEKDKHQVSYKYNFHSVKKQAWNFYRFIADCDRLHEKVY